MLASEMIASDLLDRPSRDDAIESENQRNLQMKNGKKGVALLSGAVMLSSTLGASVLTATPAQAADSKKSKQLKTGAIALGAAAAYFALKGKTAPAAVAAAGGYYAYKKSKDEKNQGYAHSGNAYPDDQHYAHNTNNGNVYPTTAGDSSGDYASSDYYPADSNDGTYASYPDDTGYNGGYNGFSKKAKTVAKTSLPTVLK